MAKKTKIKIFRSVYSQKDLEDDVNEWLNTMPSNLEIDNMQYLVNDKYESICLVYTSNDK